MNKDILYLGSQSAPRRGLLEQAHISHKVLEHASDEKLEQGGLSFDEYVIAIAEHKMEHLCLPEVLTHDSGYLFVVTADTLIRTANSNRMMGKPKDKHDAIGMLTACSVEPVEVATGCCLEKKVARDGLWVTELKTTWVTSSLVDFFLPEDQLENYFAHVPTFMNACGGAIIEGYGQLFVKSIQGSYSSIKGLPLFQLREKLAAMHFNF